MSSLLDKVKKKMGLTKQQPGHRLGGGGQEQEGGSTQAKPKIHRELCEEQKDARREAMANAAASREKAWDKKVSRGAQVRRQEEQRKQQGQDQGTFPQDIRCEETLKTVQAAKLSEQQLAQSLGYNPYQPVVSSSATSSSRGGELGTTTTIASTSTPEDHNAGWQDDLFDDVPEDVHLQLAAALQCLLPHAGEPQPSAALEQGKVCVRTVVKLLTNLAANPDEPKFRSIRLSNKHFSNKVAEVEGGLELVMCAGFVLEEEQEQEQGSGGEGGGGGGGDTFLRHAGGATSLAARQLQFVLSRLNHIQSLFA